MTPVNNQALNDFLAVVGGSKEVGLAIVQDEKGLEELSRTIEAQGFIRSHGAANLLTLPRTYFVANENMAKDIYDFVVQYPTGQVEIFDTARMRTQTLSPDYQNRAIIVLVRQDNLSKLTANGFNLLAAVGPAYQS